MLSISSPEEARMKRPYIIFRNWVACAISEVVFVPFAEKRTKTFALAKRVLSAKIPIFTTDHESNHDLHELGIPGLTRKSAGGYLENLGAHRAQAIEKEVNRINLSQPIPDPEKKPPKFIQGKFNF